MGGAATGACLRRRAQLPRNGPARRLADGAARRAGRSAGCAEGSGKDEPWRVLGVDRYVCSC